MAGLLYKELIVNKKSLISMALGEIVVSLLLIAPLIFKDDFADADILSAILSVFVFFVMFLTIGMLSANIFEADETKKWAYFVTSTPLSVKGQIGAKYLFVLLIYLGLFLYCYYLSVFTAVFGGAANFMVAFEMLWIMVLASAIEFPFLIRFGCKAGGHVKTAAGLALMMILFEYIFFGDTSVFLNEDKLLALMDKLSDPSKMADVSIVIFTVIPFFSAGAYFLSYKLSCKFYLKGAEDYER